jgi:hypothetical protein
LYRSPLLESASSTESGEVPDVAAIDYLVTPQSLPMFGLWEDLGFGLDDNWGFTEPNPTFMG